MKEQELVVMRDICKSFGEVRANHHVNLSVKKGEVHALLGENGAGKSTLMNMLSGIYLPDSGSIHIEGKEVAIRSPKESIELGIGMIHQHYKLVDVASAKENIIMGQKGSFFLNKQKLSIEIRQLSEQYQLDVDPDQLVYNMSIGEKQTVEIVKVLYRGANILILDEPTAVLTPQETEKLFTIIRHMKEAGCAVIIITHKLHEVMAISDRVTVLRKGTTVATVTTSETTPKALTDLMVGGSVDLSIERITTDKKEENLLSVSHLTARNQDKVKVLDNLSFQLRGGEILGIAGVAGSGQKELCEAIAGLYPVEKGTITYQDENLVGKSPRDIIKKGISMSFIPEDRLGMGLVASMDMVDNLLLKSYTRDKGFFVKRKPLKEKCHTLIKQLDIKTPGIYHPIKQLSGGNIQKVLLGREIDSNPHVLITAYPVRGLDIGASHTIYDLLNDQKQAGVGILFVGEDIDVLLELCDCIMVLCGGKITGLLDARHTTKEEIGYLMAGESLEEGGRKHA